MILFQSRNLAQKTKDTLNIKRQFDMLLRFSYIRKKELDEIEKAYGTSTTDKLKMYSKQAKLIYSQGWAALKKDIYTFRSLRQKQAHGIHNLTLEEERLKKRMWQELAGLKNLFIIQILPFSGPLLIYYIYVYPTSIPSWFTVDEIHQKYQLECIENQAKAIQHFKKHPMHFHNFELHHLKRQELKDLSLLLFGHYEDGLRGLDKFKPHHTKQYLLHPSFSRYLTIRNIKKQFERETKNNPDIYNQHHSLNQLILIKYQRIMRGQEKLVFQPVLVDHQVNKASGESNADPLNNGKTK